MTRNELIALRAGAVAALVLLLVAAKKAPGASLKVPAREVESIPPFQPPPGLPVLGPDQHIGQYAYTPHRYPAACGNDITAAIHGGFSTMALPADGDAMWLGRSPSEADL
jgi:hypothetical protein